MVAMVMISHNGLREGDVALCCPEASVRQGNIANTLLVVRYLLFLDAPDIHSLTFWKFFKNYRTILR
jgi:hypothetical protein